MYHPTKYVPSLWPLSLSLADARQLPHRGNAVNLTVSAIVCYSRMPKDSRLPPGGSSRRVKEKAGDAPKVFALRRPALVEVFAFPKPEDYCPQAPSVTACAARDGKPVPYDGWGEIIAAPNVGAGSPRPKPCGFAPVRWFRPAEGMVASSGRKLPKGEGESGRRTKGYMKGEGLL